MHTAMLAVQKADLSFQMMMAVRSKLIDAYRGSHAHADVAQAELPGAASPPD